MGDLARAIYDRCEAGHERCRTRREFESSAIWHRLARRDASAQICRQAVSHFGNEDFRRCAAANFGERLAGNALDQRVGVVDRETAVGADANDVNGKLRDRDSRVVKLAVGQPHLGGDGINHAPRPVP